MQNQDLNHTSGTRQRGNSLPHSSRTMAPTQSASLGHRQQHSDESWIEIGSRPSSSSLSSVADEIITTGLRVQHDSNLHRRRRRARSAGHSQIGAAHRTTHQGGASSQEEYEESESESDRVMTSSTEGIGPSPLQNEIRRASRNLTSVASSDTMSEREGDADDDDDENATAVNYPRSAQRHFEPRPNAFSHPPTTLGPQLPSTESYQARRPALRPSSQRNSYPLPQHTPYNVIAPSYQADHDEALRASLSTLLSAAAAVRGLPKPGQPRANYTNTSNRIDTTSLRMVPESVALGGVTEETASERLSSRSPPSSPRTMSSNPSDKSKRKAALPGSSNARSSSKDRRVAKKARRTGPLVDEISPTLLTWVVSAGVVVIVSAISFSAGYMVGKEAGHAEALSQIGGASAEAGSCAKEAAGGIGRAGMGLRRLRFTAATGVRV